VQAEHSPMANFAGLAALFVLGAGIAAALPRPLPEDKKVLRQYRKRQPRKGAKKTGGKS